MDSKVRILVDTIEHFDNTTKEQTVMLLPMCIETFYMKGRMYAFHLKRFQYEI